MLRNEVKKDFASVEGISILYPEIKKETKLSYYLRITFSNGRGKTKRYDKSFIDSILNNI